MINSTFVTEQTETVSHCWCIANLRCPLRDVDDIGTVSFADKSALIMELGWLMRGGRVEGQTTGWTFNLRRRKHVADYSQPHSSISICYGFKPKRLFEPTLTVLNLN